MVIIEGGVTWEDLTFVTWPKYSAAANGWKDRTAPVMVEVIENEDDQDMIDSDSDSDNATVNETIYL